MCSFFLYFAKKIPDKLFARFYGLIIPNVLQPTLFNGNFKHN